MAGYADNTANAALMTFARVEVTPDNKSYLNPDNWTLLVDESITPIWLTPQHKEVCMAAHKKWEAKLRKILVRKEIIHPFELSPPKIGKSQILLLKQWASVGDSVGASVWASVGDSVGASVWASVGASVGASVWASVGASVWASVGASVWASVGASVGAVGAYAGSFFRLPTWKYIKHAKGKYPYAPLVKLWEQGLVPSFDGTTWRLHGGKKAEVLYEWNRSEVRVFHL